MSQSTSNGLPLFTTTDASMAFQESRRMIDEQEMGWKPPMYSESFELDLANIWTSEFWYI